MEKLTDIFFTDVFKDKKNFLEKKPIPMIFLDKFLPEDVAISMYEEINSIDDSFWKKFTRNGSHMMELNKIELTPVAFNVMSYLHSAPFLNNLTKLTGIQGLIPDPHLIGAGYSKSFKGDTLKIHTDFNWNDTLKLHRALSLIIYLTPDWDVKWHGGLDFYDSERKTVIEHIDCIFNRCLIWKYNKLGWHGHVNKLDCPPEKIRTTFRLFYYTSNSTYLNDDPPHRSQYWYDPIQKMAYDIKEEQ